MRTQSPFCYTILIGCLTSLFLSCNSNQNDANIPDIFAKYISERTTGVAYKQLTPNDVSNHIKAPDSLSTAEALEDIEMLEYLWKTSYSGYEYWKYQGVDFESFISSFKFWASQSPHLKTSEFEAGATSILQEIYDGHISFIGAGYYGAYRHKAVYFTDILVEEMVSGEFQVIDSQNDMVSVGAVFTQSENTNYLFQTLSPPGKKQFLVGLFTFDPQRSIQLSFDNQMLEIPLHKNRLLNARFDDKKPFYITRRNDIPVIRVTGFGDVLYPIMKDFMQSGFELQKEDLILINLFNNGGGSSVYPQTFLKNLNGSVQWDVHWAELTSPAIAAYYANYELNSSTSPGMKRLVSRYMGQHEKLLSFPTKSWTFLRDEKKQVEGKFKGTLILMTNRRVLSAGENLVGASTSMTNRITIGENTGGVAQFSSTCEYVLPHSRMVLNLPRQLIFIPGLEECVGYLPDYWLDTHEPLEEVLKWLETPEQYQFKYAQSYDEFLESLAITTVLPKDAQISAPGPDVPDSLARYSGKWFGVSDGILDHMLVVEKITNSTGVDAIYAWGVAYQWGINQPGWERFKGVFEDGKLLLKRTDGGQTITYWINSDGSMSSVYERPGIYSRTEMTKLPSIQN
ncbi:MAG: hypothetical protein H8E26_04680 [FCB group bacterium]|nr:hypothetical protein [FCB group bacterium]MBL7028323.1 hypothetical protein [Candidatus Neomarinimicrobiota bacterium]MBL7121642.1 hypothetical protein [Candidatus Neomarinimicrobiota bacterium]